MMVMYDPCVRWTRDLSGYEPGVWKGWEYNEDGTSITFFFREGMKYSDGVPFTTDDLRFWWEDLCLDEDFGDISIPGWGYLKGELMTVDFIDDYTIRFTFAYPNWILPYTLAQGFWVWEPLMTPRHYLEQFHPKYNPEMEGDYTLLGEMRLWHHNPDHPVLFAWRPVEYEAGVRLVVERNPYYWKVDTAGNQLPYIDRIVSEEVADAEVRLLKYLAGEIDASWRTGSYTPMDIPVLLEAAEATGLRWMSGWVAGEANFRSLWPNQDYAPDEYIRDLLRDKNFRQGLSHAYDRDHINDVMCLGMGTPTAGTMASPEAIHFQSTEGKAIYEEWRTAYIEYDVALANQLLDAAGLDARDPATGFRLRADTGEVFELLVDAAAPVTVEGGVLLGLSEKYFEDVGIMTTLNIIPAAELNHRFEEGLYHLRLWDGPGAEIDLFTYPENVFVTGLYTRCFPLQGRWFATGGAEGWEPGPVAQALYDLYVAALAEPDMEKRHICVHDAVRIHIDEGPFYIGTVLGLPLPVFVKENFRNVPDYGVLAAWAPGAPGATNPEQFFFKTE